MYYNKEIGPRVSLRLRKIESGLSTGEVLYHSLIHRSEKEKEELERRISSKIELKNERKRIQDENVEKKKLKLIEKKNKKILKKRKNTNFDKNNDNDNEK